MNESRSDLRPPSVAPVIHLDIARGVRAHTPLKVLHRVLKNADLYNEWIHISRESTAVKPFTLNVARYLGNVVPSIEGQCPLLLETLRHGIRGWNRTDGTTTDHFRGYIRGVLSVIPEALDWRIEVMVNGVVSTWNPLEHCVVDWWTKHRAQPQAIPRERDKDSMYVALSPPDYRLIVLAKFLVRGAVDLSSIGYALDELTLRYG